jgi:hypothetical protein
LNESILLFTANPHRRHYRFYHRGKLICEGFLLDVLGMETAKVWTRRASKNII